MHSSQSPERCAISEFFCAIPARGGSERLPRKNLAILHGRPLITHTIEAAIATGRFTAVYVCTDDEEIATIARGHGALVPELVPADLAGPLVPSHVPCRWLRDLVAPAADTLVCLQPTSPLRSAADIDHALSSFAASGADFLVSLTPIDPHYFHWACIPDESGWQLFFGDRYLRERPLLPAVFRPNGAIKIARFAALERTGHFFGAPLDAIDMPEDRSVHVATALDLAVCDLLMRSRAS